LNGLDISVPSRRPLSINTLRLIRILWSPKLIIFESNMGSVSKLLHSTDPRIITNYVFTRFVSRWSGELGERFDDVSQVSSIAQTYIWLTI
ncbi:hypothetical protein COOONC_27513, partial [Cooperia oncophora]